MRVDQCLLYHCVCLYLTGEGDYLDVRSAVADLAGRWKDFGLSLGIGLSDLDAIDLRAKAPSECLREILALWLRQSYNVRTTLVLRLFCLHQINLHHGI